jgi:hypothetical protein
MNSSQRGLSSKNTPNATGWKPPGFPGAVDGYRTIGKTHNPALVDFRQTDLGMISG